MAASTADYRILSSDPPPLHHDAAPPRVHWPLHSTDKTHLQLGLVRHAALDPEFGPDPRLLDMTVHAQSRTRLCIEIENAHRQPWKVPQSIVPRHPASSKQAQKQAVDYTVVWEDPDSFGFTILRTSSNERLFDTSGLGLTMKDQYLELSTRLTGDAADDDDRGRPVNLYGLGENMGPLRREPGTTSTHWARDSPCKPHRNLYGSHPFFLQILPSGRAHGVLLLTSNGMDVVMAPEGDRLTYKIIGGALELYVFTGPTPQQVIQQYTQLIGRPCMVPYYSLGFHMCRWGYDTVDKAKAVVAEFKRHALPLEALWIDIDYMEDYKCFTFDQTRYPVKQLAALADELHANNQHLIMILDPGIKLQYQMGLYEPYDEGVARNLFIKRKITAQEAAEDKTAKLRAGDLVDFVGKVWPGKTVFPDWFHPEAQEYWTKHIAAWLQQVPLDGIWIDMNEAASFHDGDCSHIESSDDRPVRLSDFAPAEPADPLDEDSPKKGSLLQPQHLQQPQHAQSDSDAKKKRKHAQAHSTHSKGGHHHSDTQPKEEIALREHEYEDLHDPHALERNKDHGYLPSMRLKKDPTSEQGESRPPVIYTRPNQPPYSINNNNEYAELEYRTLSVDALHHGDITEYDAHNLYGHMEGIATYQALRTIQPTKKPFILSRSTFVGSGQYVAKWTGDNWSSEEDMRASIAGLLNFQLFGISMVGADIGGFGDAASEELLIRWHQLGAFYPFMRNHNCIVNPPQEPYISTTLTEVTRTCLHLRYRLLPHWYTLFYRARMVCSPLWVLDPKDPELLAIDDQFLVGESLLVSPALCLEQNVVEARFPPGRWYDLHSGLLEVYVGSTGKEVVSSEVIEIDAPLSKIPVHVRGGNILALASTRDNTALETTRQVRDAPLQILVALDETERARGECYHDDDSFETADGTLVKMEARPGVFTLIAHAARSTEHDHDDDGAGEVRTDEEEDGGVDYLQLPPVGHEGQRSTAIQSISVWGLSLGAMVARRGRRVSADEVKSSAQLESHQVRST
ncbi:hypothetical protein BGZ70_010421 [Mortierella alpina]|uniref:Maltase n=1 Tax=Mortierella alpina TaxID=64518 RepID=A0A9P6M647_MORAP|nr:hypothetical protein BGZ70_010421 [Mortierella alpina]